MREGEHAVRENKLENGFAEVILVIFLACFGIISVIHLFGYAADAGESYSRMEAYVAGHPAELPAMVEDCQKNYPLRYGAFECNAILRRAKALQKE